MAKKTTTSSKDSSGKVEGIKKGSHIGEALNESSLPDFKHTPKPPPKTSETKDSGE